MKQDSNFLMPLKRILLVLILAMSSMYSVAQDQLFKQFDDAKGVSTVYISPTMFRLMPKLEFGDKDITKIASKLTKLQVLECERPSLIPTIKKQATNYYKTNKYEVVMKIKDKDERTTIYLKSYRKNNNEFILMNEEPKEITIIQLVGHITLSEIKNITK